MQKIAFDELFRKYQDFEINPANESIEKVGSRINDKDHFYYYIKAKDRIVGAINITDKKDGSNKRIAPIFILPEFQGYGYAQNAILYAERIHGKHGWVLETILQEPKLCRLYEKMGYKRTGKIAHVSDKMDLIFFEKK
ncbi:MAG: GNAT family N-acetyltransferase [Oscillospiraceae bacterium]